MSARWKGCWEKRVSETTWLYSPWISFTIAPNVNRGYEFLLFKSEEGRKKALKTFMGTECLELLNFVSNFILEGAWQFASLWRQTLLWVIFKGEGTKAALAESQRCEWLAVFSVVSGSTLSLRTRFQSHGNWERWAQTPQSHVSLRLLLLVS